ncbi:hypothetical protein [Bacillus tropicus]|uniref:hypothetical protein n=1 Tax=Bacillus tropicus TaxID=2026188 RepID=UPI0035DA8CA0
MENEIQKILHKIVKIISRIQSVLCFIMGTLFLTHLNWDTYWYGLGCMLTGLFFWNYNTLLIFVEQEDYRKR